MKNPKPKFVYHCYLKAENNINRSSMLKVFSYMDFFDWVIKCRDEFVQEVGCSAIVVSCNAIKL